jgi:hypothetical protein
MLAAMVTKETTWKGGLTMSAGLEWNENVPFTDPKNSEMRMLCFANQLLASTVGRCLDAHMAA